MAVVYSLRTLAACSACGFAGLFGTYNLPSPSTDSTGVALHSDHATRRDRRCHDEPPRTSSSLPSAPSFNSICQLRSQRCVVHTNKDIILVSLVPLRVWVPSRRLRSTDPL
ncbi:hypothetical protein BC834DRAFT_37862 [Gloeopeniophorella convolvens]|nr:hypothetical protein BC834DRAFT_37862 [Gloeopeniophorella convolvens]